MAYLLEAEIVPALKQYWMVREVLLSVIPTPEPLLQVMVPKFKLFEIVLLVTVGYAKIPLALPLLSVAVIVPALIH